ncbi:MAG: hypothetical protein QOC69_5472 [Mycobacterium sp.]|jgi:hypothetical protein|nr:hypothetical protein [Mycobacterium sp.]
MDEHAYRVGAAVEYLVRRMETFCTVSGTDVFMYEGRVRAGIPVRMSATNVMRGQARNYGIHRELYPEDTRRSCTASPDHRRAPKRSGASWTHSAAR